VITYTPRTRALLWKTPDDFGQKYCRNCQCGWTREGKDSEGKDNAVLTICLLDREPIMEGITRCDRFEPKEEEAEWSGSCTLAARRSTTGRVKV
jgi:hypothetical protein